jgi:transcriptional regulator of acetoin/glycerol metabolism
VRVLEWIYTDESLRRSGGNVTAAARDAGISRPSFHRKMRELEIEAETYRR